MKQKLIEEKKLIEREETPHLKKVVTLFFQRADNLKKTVTIKTTMEELMENAIALACEKLRIRKTSIGITGGGEPVEFVGKTVGEVIKRYNTDTFQIATTSMLG